MKKTFVIMLAFFSLLSFTLAEAAHTEPQAFRGIKWGALISEVEGLTLLPVHRSDEGTYVKKGEALKMGKADLQAIKYVFYKNRFYMGIIEFKTLSNYKKLKAGLEKDLGAGKLVSVWHKKYSWDLPDVNVAISYDPSKKDGTVIYYYKPIEKEKVINRDNQEMMEDMKESE